MQIAFLVVSGTFSVKGFTTTKRQFNNDASPGEGMQAGVQP